MSAPRIIAATGHRPQKLGGYTYEINNRLLVLARQYLAVERPDAVVSGMALGWDMAYADAAIALQIPVIAAVPFAGHDGNWPHVSQERYRQILKVARVVVVSDGGYSAAKMQVRNEWMVNYCTSLVALWDGTSGGTANCVEYARRVGRPTINLWPLWRTNNVVV